VAAPNSQPTRPLRPTKLTFLAALALLATAPQATAGEVRESRRNDLVAMVGEVAAVARAEGAAVEAMNANDVVALFDGIPAGMKSSMQRDAETGRRLELDAIGGAVVRGADRHGIPVPVTSRYVDELRARYPS
jgi:2-dehydropantoate 2-reductase